MGCWGRFLPRVFPLLSLREALDFAPGLLGGTVAGYLAYDWMHYYTHHATPKTRFGKFMRRFHLEHHLKIASSQFGLSSPLWDLALGTFWTTGALKRSGGRQNPSADAHHGSDSGAMDDPTASGA